MPKSTNYEIKTTLAIDGEKAFKAAMDDANRAMRVHNADLRAMAAEYDYTDDKQRYFAQRAELVNEKIKQQEAIVEALGRAVKESGEKYGDAARQTDGYRIQMSNATAKLFEMRKEAETANRELEELGRDSGKIGRQIERGIGDAAEDTADKLESMYSKVAKDVNELKSSVAFQTAMDVGGFMLNGIQSVMGFVQENQDLNTQISYAKHNMEARQFEWDEVQDLVVKAAATTNNMEGGIEAISHLAQLDFESKELMESALNAFLGGYIRTGSALSVEGLAEDFRASVVNRVPTGTYAEVLEELLKDVNVEVLTEALSKAKTEQEAIEIALSPLTEGGLQTTFEKYNETEKELQNAKAKNVELSMAWAQLATDVQPFITGAIDIMADVVEETSETVKRIKAALAGVGYVPTDTGLPDEETYAFFDQLNNNLTNESFYDQAELVEGEIKRLRKYGTNWETINEVLSGELEELKTLLGEEPIQPITAEWLESYFNTEKWKEKRESTKKSFWEFLIPSAGAEELPAGAKTGMIASALGGLSLVPSASAETLPTDDLQDYGFRAMQEIANGMLTDAKGNSAINAAVQTALAEMSAKDVIDAARLSGKNLMIEFGNGIAEGTSIPLNNVANMVNQINAMLSQITAPAFGLGWSGITGGNIYLYNQQRNSARALSKMIGRGVQVEMVKN